MADRSIKVILRAEIADFKAKMSEAQKATESFGKGASDWVSKNSASIGTLTNSIGLVGAGLTALGGLAVKKFADFDQAMSNVAATGQDARASLDALRDAAIDAGQRTAYSATEAAGAIENLAKAGVSANDILGGALAGSLDLAAAGGLEVADAAEIASIAMTQFSLSGSDVGHVADLLAAGAGKANGSVADLGAALKQSGLVAAQTGLTIEETTASLAAFAAAGLLGSDAGTSLKTMLQRLTNPSAEAAAEMERLGISAYDAAGNFVGMEALAGQLKDGLDDLTPAQRNAALSIIFGADAVRAASVLYAEGAEGIASWTAKVDDAGYAAEVAAIRMDNLKGDLEQLGGSLETALIGMGSAADGPLRSFVQALTNIVNTFAQLPPAVQGGLGILVGGSGLLLLGVAAVGKFAVAITEAKGALVALGIVSEATGNKVAGFAAKAGLAVGKVALIVGALELLNGATTSAGVGLNEMQTKLEGLSRSSDVVKSIFGDFVPENQIARGKDFLEQVVEPMANPSTWGSIGNHLEDLGISFERLFGGQAVKWSEITQRMADVDSALASMATSNLPDAVEGFQALYEEVGGTQEAGVALLGALPGLRDALIGVASDAGLATDDASLLAIALGDVAPAADGMAGSLGEQAGAAEATADAIERLIAAYDEMNGESLNLLDATSAWEEALDGISAALEKNGQTTDLSTEAGRANVQVLTDLARKASDLAQATYDSTGSTDQFYASLDASRQALADTAVAMGMSAEQAWAFVDSVLAIPPAPAVTPTVDTTEADGQLESLILNIDSASGTITVNGNPVPAETTLGQLLGNVDAATGTVTIGGNRYPADTTLAGFLALTNTSTGTVTVAANTGGAEASINYTARPRSTTITVGVLYQGLSTAGGSLAQRPAAKGGLIAYGRVVRGYAGGGLVPGVPPADRTRDNVLALGPGGLFALRSQEFVATQESTARNYSALVAGNRGATLGVVRAGYAGGGIVGAARSASGLGAGVSAEDVRAAVRAGVAEALAAGVSARFGNPRALATYIDAELTLAASRQAGGR